ncbi:NADH:flavin oxidoreductase [Burkholderiales bacterium JOSHI_001]|nr:NADH:flavin oxidoreductase [Burkholderiales bacterium JOSHI_001]
MNTPSLFDTVRLGELQLPNRIVMAPLTRNRAVGTVPQPVMARYYAQRANPATGAGLIVSEATQISPMGQGYLDTPGIHSPEQVAAWIPITAAVHAVGGRIVCQLWHVGRISHSSLLPGGAAPVSSSTRVAHTKTLTAEGFAPCSPPRALRADEMPGIVADYVHAARCALDAGFDGVEVHAANGYLIDQFLRDGQNDRSDEWGGSVENRTRLFREVMAAVAAAVGAGRTGVRVSPIAPVNDLALDSDPAATFGHALAAVAPLKLAYVHVVEGSTGGPRDVVPGFDFQALRHAAGADQGNTAWMVNNGYTRDMAQAVVASGQADLVAFGKPFISNPDLGRRLRENLPWTEGNRKTYYGGGAEGYTDYPAAQ